MEEVIVIGGFFTTKTIIYFKESFKFIPDGSKRGVNFLKDTPYLVTNSYNYQRIGKMSTDLYVSSRVMEYESKSYQVNLDDLNNMIKYIDSMYPKHLSGKIDNNLKLSATMYVGDDRVFKTLDKLKNNIVSVSKYDNKYIDLLLIFNKGTYLNIDIDLLEISKINSDTLNNIIPIDRYSMDGNSLNRLIKSFRSTYKIDSNKDYIIK